MAGSLLMQIGTRALFANYAALQTTGHNIANANTEGYSRQSLELETAGGQFTGSGFFGKGVNVTLGLPFVRTSVDHGTALDLAGQGRADAGSLIEATKLAIELASAA